MPQPEMITIQSSTIHISQIDAVANIVDTSGVLDLIEQWTQEERDLANAHPGGRPAEVSPRTALILMLALGVEATALLVSEARNLVCGRLTKNAWTALGFKENEYKKHDRWTNKDRYTWYFRIYRAIKRILAVVDPYPETSNYVRMEKSEYLELKATRDPALVVRRKARATKLMNALVWASVESFGEDRLVEWKGDITTDGTSLKVSRNGTSAKGRRAAADPDAGWYKRDGDHGGNPEQDDPEKLKWAYELTVSAMFGGGFGKKYPALVAGIAMDRPGVRPFENALWSLDHIIGNPALPKGTFIGDRNYYPHARPQDLNIPLRRAGYSITGDFLTKKLGAYGIQATHEGAIQVDGIWFCPSIKNNERYLYARRDRDLENITDEQYEQIVEERAKFALKRKDVNKQTGNVRYSCPAQGTCPSVSCSLANSVKSKTKDARKNPKALLPIMPVNQPVNPGSVCTQGTITIPMEWEQKSSPDKRSSGRATPKARVASRGGKSAGTGAGVSQNGTGVTPGAPRPPRARKGTVVVDDSYTGAGVSTIERGGVTVGTYAKYEQTGPHHGSKQWRELYGTGRNVVESRNSLLKGDGGSGVRLDSTRSRLMRGWVEQFFLLAVGVVSVNLRLIQSWLRGQGDPVDKGGPGGRGPGRPKKDRKKRVTVTDLASGNDPPAQAA